MYKCALILAAGQGKRIKSDLPKVLHKVCGKEMVNHVIDTLRKSDIDAINVIVGKGAELVKENTKSRNVTYSLQEEQLGTGHAVKCAIDFLNGKKGTVAVFNGDAPLITEETIKAIAQQEPYYFVMRDSSMASDSVATNFDQIFATYSPDTVRKVL